MVRDRAPAVRRAAIIAAAGGLSIFVAGCQSPPIRMPSITSAPQCSDLTIAIYFEPASAVITKEAAALLHSAGNRAHRCNVTGVDVVGLASAAGDSATNMQISKDRAAAVTAALAGSGFDHVDINATAVGDAGAERANGEVRPLRRRARVTFHLAPKA